MYIHNRGGRAGGEKYIARGILFKVRAFPLFSRLCWVALSVLVSSLWTPASANRLFSGCTDKNRHTFPCFASKAIQIKERDRDKDKTKREEERKRKKERKRRRQRKTGERKRGTEEHEQKRKKRDRQEGMTSILCLFSLVSLNKS